ncbi:MAG TPA: serine hydrolase [Gemmatimonadaceae bacterium]|jgi:CubicO group peptidase (beta-lactamase class C family)|nr:serine hydrolase [Gemmatimonadaceae bacterium]
MTEILQLIHAMQMRSFFSASVSVLLAAPFALAQTSAEPSPAELDRVFAQWSSNEGPGCAVAASRDGRTIYEAAYGMANLETGTPITPASIFHSASVSKQFTAMALMLLARDGKLSLDDEVRKYIPELPDYGHRITLRHLLHHTSGLRDQWDLLALSRGRFEEDRITEADVLDIVTRQKALNFVPETEYLYSNTGYTLAGTVVHRVSGKTLRQFADERIFKPLGMTSTHFHDDYHMIVKGRTSAYARRPDGQWRVSIPNFDTYGATSLYTTVGDLLEWQENFRKTVVGDTAMLREMQTSAVLANGDTTGYGLGVSVGGGRGRMLVGHSGADAGYRAYTGRYPEYGFAIAVLCNASTSNPSALADSVSKLFVKALRGGQPAAPVVAKTPPAAEQLGRYAGLYVNATTGGMNWVSVKDGKLIAGRTSGPELVPLGGNRFWFDGPRSELEFTADGKLVLRFRGTPPRQPVTLVRHEPARPSVADLARYVGSYYSEELDATYTVAVTDTALALRTGTSQPRTVTPAYRDTFVGFARIEFTRDASGRIAGMLVSTGRTRNVRFDRVR